MREDVRARTIEWMTLNRIVLKIESGCSRMRIFSFHWILEIQWAPIYKRLFYKIRFLILIWTTIIKLSPIRFYFSEREKERDFWINYNEQNYYQNFFFLFFLPIISNSKKKKRMFVTFFRHQTPDTVNHQRQCPSPVCNFSNDQEYKFERNVSSLKSRKHPSNSPIGGGIKLPPLNCSFTTWRVNLPDILLWKINRAKPDHLRATSSIHRFSRWLCNQY